MKEYDKIIRDLVPQVMDEANIGYEIETVDDATALEYLYKKLLEETDELLHDKTIEEVIDVIEVAFAIAEKYGYDFRMILYLREAKRREKGGFKQNIVLKKTFDKSNNQ
jgi:predicted house-cleaning noncanonical NTP pyrophosphatase (MazG superfamily)